MHEPFDHPTRIRMLRAQANAIPMLDSNAEAELLERVRMQDDRDAMAQLITAHLRLVVAIAARHQRAGLSISDLVAEGNLGLVEAARRFDRSKDARFATYAAWWVRARISRYSMGNRRIVPAPSSRNARRLFASLRRTTRELEGQLGRPPTRSEIAAATNTSEDDVALVEVALGARDTTVDAYDELTCALAGISPSPEDTFADAEEQARAAYMIGRALEELDGREREIVRRRFFEGESDSDTLATIGRDLGLSRERVRQLELRAKYKLRSALSTLAA
jgi:RNA polymerase sigma-32 factor